MRHFNSAEERAKREEAPAGRERAGGFRHYNHPEEVAKRQGKSGAVVVPPQRPQRRVIQAEGWPPPGEDNTASVAVLDASTVPRELGPAVDALPLERLARLEALLYTLLDSREEAREFRMLMNNLSAVTDSQARLGNRLRAVEVTLDQLVEPASPDEAAAAGGDEPRDTQPPAGDAADNAPSELPT